MNAPQPIASDRFRRVADFDEAAKELRLRENEWRVLLALDGATALEVVASRLGLDLSYVIDAVARFEAGVLVEAQLYTLSEYRMRTALEQSPRSPEPPASVAAEHEPENGTAPRVAFSLRRDPPRSSESAR